MHILFVTSEIAPYSQSGEVARVCAALPKALHALGHAVTVLSPLYESISPAAFSLARRLSGCKVVFGDREVECELYDGRTAGGVNLLFLGNREFFAELEPGQFAGGEKEAASAVLFSKAAIEVAKNAYPPFQILHAHDWLAALTLVWAKRVLPDLPRVLSLHDPRKQGQFDVDIAALRLDTELEENARAQGSFNLIKTAIESAHFVITPSHAAAASLVREGFGHGLESALSTLGDKLSGIVSGIDASTWNPLTDVHIKSRFHPNDLSGKERCKVAFQHELGLPLRSDIPLVTAFGALDWEHGGDLLAQAAEDALSNDIQWVVVADEQAINKVGLFSEVCLRYPDRIKVRASGDEALRHRAISASDFVLIPCRVDPYGTLAMCAQRYGALPVALKTGNIDDTVVDCDSPLKSGSGFLFESDSAQEFLAALQRATAAYFMREAFEDLRKRTMRIDHSWERSARRYDLLYKGLAGI